MVYYEDVLDQEGCTELAEFSKLNFTRAVLVNLDILLQLDLID